MLTTMLVSLLADSDHILTRYTIMETINEEKKIVWLAQIILLRPFWLQCFSPSGETHCTD